MYKQNTVGIIIPAHNEALQIEKVILNLPDFVDRILVVNDASVDDTKVVVENIIKSNPKVTLINHDKNRGVGAAMATGYKWARDEKIDIAVRMDGDGQMDVNDLENLLLPITNGEADFTKGNRLFTGEAYRKMPKLRYYGNAVLSMMTKVASGYWHVTDSQTGYTAISKKALSVIDWDKMYKKYGQPNDLLVRLNIYDFRVKDVPVKPIYDVGEKSGLKIRKVIFTIPWLLLRLFLWRMKEKYVIRNFHPLVFFYLLGLIFFILTAVLFVRLFVLWHFNGKIPPINALAAMFSFMSASMFSLFAMWFDMESNKELKA